MTPDRHPADDPARRLAALEGDGLDGVPPTAEELAAARLTAHGLGELPAAEAAEIDRALAAPAAASDRESVAETRALAERLRTAAAARRQSAGPTGSPSPVGSPSLRTAVTAALATRDLPKAPAAPAPRVRVSGPSRSRSILALLATGGTAAAALLAIMANPDPLEPSPAFSPVEEIAGRAAPAPSAPAAASPAGPTAARSLERMVTKALPADADARPEGGPAPSAAVGGDGAVAVPLGDLAETNRELAEAPFDAVAVVQGRADEKAAMPAAGPGSGGAVSGRARVPAPGARGGRGQLAAAEKRKELLSEPAPLFGKATAQAYLGSQGPQGRIEPDQPAGGGRWFNDRDLHAYTPGAPGTERYARFVENSFRNPAEEGQALSTFSIDVDTASYSLVRRFLNDRQVPPPEAVRLEEMLNYFRYDDPAPAGDDPLAVRLESAACPWQPDHRLLRVALKGRDIVAAARPGTSLVFLVDVSGSMNEPNKLPLVKQSLSMLVEQLTESDKVAIVTYAGDAGVKLAPTSGDQKDRIRAAIDALSAGGSTNGSAGIEVAYRLAQEAFVKGGSNRVLLATDGDLNVGITDDRALVGLIKEKAGSGVFLTVLGFGQGNLQDEKMEKLADNGNGIYAYVDGAREARKVLVEQLTGSTVTIAKDVKIQIEFNPAQVAAYRLLGYENRLLAARDFKDDTKDAGEVGAGHGVTALYEIVPVAAAGKAPVDEPLKYQPKPAVEPARAADAAPASPELCTVKLRWKAPEASESVERNVPFEDAGGAFEAASSDLRFAAAVAEFGMLLRESRHRGQASLEHVASTASGALGRDPGGLRAEFLDLVREAGALLPYERRGTPN